MENSFIDFGKLSEEKQKRLLRTYSDLKNSMSSQSSDNFRSGEINMLEEIFGIAPFISTNKTWFSIRQVSEFDGYDFLLSHIDATFERLKDMVSKSSEPCLVNLNFLNPLKSRIIAELKIYLLIKFSYGGIITEEEWEDDSVQKYQIVRSEKKFEIIDCDVFYYKTHSLLTFHTFDQAKEFLDYNESLVCKYLMFNPSSIY